MADALTHTASGGEPDGISERSGRTLGAVQALPPAPLPRDPSSPAGLASLMPPASLSGGWGLSWAEGPRVLGVSLPLLLRARGLPGTHTARLEAP